MKSKIKKILLVCLSALMIFAFVSCDSDESDNQSSNAAKHEQSQASNSTGGESQTSDQYAQYVGKYVDQTSQRALLEVKENDSKTGLVMSIRWATSATIDSEWTMTGTIDGNKIVYSDCVAKTKEYDNNGKVVKEETVNFNAKGYFEIVKKNLNWTGSGDEECNKCVFAKEVQ